MYELTVVVLCSRFKELTGVFVKEHETGVEYGALNAARLLKALHDPVSKRDTANYLATVKKAITKNNHLDEVEAHNTGNVVFPSLHDPEYSGSEEDRIKELAGGVQGVLVNGSLNTVRSGLCSS